MFVNLAKGDATAADGSRIAKLVGADHFTENDRWDVTRFWTEEELVDLGQKESAVTRVDFIDETRTELQEISDEMEVAKKELQSLTSGPTKTIGIGDQSYFHVRSGTRVTGKEIRENPGNLPNYSCFKTKREMKGLVDASYFAAHKGGRIEN